MRSIAPLAHEQWSHSHSGTTWHCNKDTICTQEARKVVHDTVKQHYQHINLEAMKKYSRFIDSVGKGCITTFYGNISTGLFHPFEFLNSSCSTVVAFAFLKILVWRQPQILTYSMLKGWACTFVWTKLSMHRKGIMSHTRLNNNWSDNDKTAVWQGKWYYNCAPLIPQKKSSKINRDSKQHVFSRIK